MAAKYYGVDRRGIWDGGVICDCGTASYISLGVTLALRHLRQRYLLCNACKQPLLLCSDEQLDALAAASAVGAAVQVLRLLGLVERPDNASLFGDGAEED